MLRPLALVAVIFFTVSGGPYGLEPLLSYGGPHGALLLLLVTPILWDIPTVLTVLELNAMMPVAGGYYQWVKRAMGQRWAFYEGWWTWLYTFVDLAIYPVLFVQYAAFFLPGLVAYKIPICLGIIWSCAGLNILGVVPVGRVSLLLGMAVLAPFLVLFAIGAGHWGLSMVHVHDLTLRGLSPTAIGMGFYTVMWNMLGWDNTTTYADRVERPARTYILSTVIAFILILLIYTFAIQSASASGIDPQLLQDKGFPILGVQMGGKWLGVALAAGGMASSLGLFAAVLLSVSQVPKVMADDKLLPESLNATHSRFGTPYMSIIVCALIVSAMVVWTFMDLIIIDITLYGAGLFLEFISLVILRIREPQAYRPFRVPLGIPGLLLLFILPVGVYCFALGGALSDTGEAWKPALFALLSLGTAPAIYEGIRIWRARTGKIDYI
jgi:amino acid transporter